MKIVKIIVDVLMLLSFAVLQSMKFTGGNLHEILGIALVLLMLVHITLNMKMTVSSFSNFGKLKAKFKISLILDILLMFVFMVCIVSGLISSRFLLNTNAPEIFSQIHILSGKISLVTCLVHLGFHLSPLFAKINKVYDNKRLAFLGECLIYVCMTLSLSVYAFRDNFYKDNKIRMKEKNPHSDSAVIDSLPQSDSFSQNDDSSQEDSVISEEESSQNENDQQISSGDETQAEETLEEYLSKMYCTGCHRHCPLTSPQCGRGQSRQQQAVSEYKQKYGTNETY